VKLFGMPKDFWICTLMKSRHLLFASVRTRQDSADCL
jgi:hypothetical protein